MSNHTQVLQALAAADTPAEHEAAIQASSPDAGKALVRMLRLAQEQHDFQPATVLQQKQLHHLSHPGAAHAAFKDATRDQHGAGLGSLLGGIAKGLLSLGKQAIKDPAVRELAGRGGKALAQKSRR